MAKQVKTSIEFINHASVIIKGDNVSIMTDPWFVGGAFNNGWKLLSETTDLAAENILNKISHIWISHEHPDHFSIPFFKKFSQHIIKNNIKVLFQETKDNRVVNFLRAQKIEVIELKDSEKLFLDDDFSVTCIKEGFYDSLLLVENYDEKILNLNDCEVRDYKKAKKIFEQTGEVDVLLTQFSYAAWKGGKARKKWRIQAAKTRLDIIDLQIEVFKPKKVIPFASFIFFSNKENFYINDSVNKPIDVINRFKDTLAEIVIMKPKDILGGNQEKLSNTKAIEFWDKRYLKAQSYQNLEYPTIDRETLLENFQNYCKRIRQRNSMTLVRLFRTISPIPIFQPVVIKITDLNIILNIDYIKGTMSQTNEKADLSMPSESLNFLFSNSFGFDTLTVNGCFDEEKEGGFSKATKTLAIENLNNIGIYVKLSIFFNMSVIFMFIRRLKKVERSLSQS